MAKILVVDDDFMIRNLLEEFLVGEGYDVILASNGEEALKKMKESPALVLLDIMMPDMHGLKVLDRIKEMAPSTEVIMVTGLNEHTVALEGIKRGAFDYITKPIDLKHLGDVIGVKLLMISTE